MCDSIRKYETDISYLAKKNTTWKHLHGEALYKATKKDIDGILIRKKIEIEIDWSDIYKPGSVGSPRTALILSVLSTTKK